MKKILFLVNTHFQLLVAISIKINLLFECPVTIYISDSSKDMDMIAERLKKTRLFNDVFLINRQKYIASSTKKLNTFFLYTFKCSALNRILPERQYDYDYIFFYNFDFVSALVIKKHLDIGNKVRICRFEEGYVSYFYNSINSDIVRFGDMLKRLWNKKIDYQEYFEAYYFFEPSFVQFKDQFEIKEIPKISLDNSVFQGIIRKLYPIENIMDSFDKKYIFLEESFSIDKKESINDMALILSIADIVGKENLVIKLHPRNMFNRFKKFGIKTCSIVGIPWEIIQYSYDFNDKVLLTVSSGSVLSSKVLFDKNIKTYLLFNCTDKYPKLVTQEYKRYLNDIFNKYGGENFIIPNSISEFITLLKNEMNLANEK